MSNDKSTDEQMQEILLNTNPKTWSLADRPETKQSHAKDYHSRTEIHSPAKNFDELSEGNKKVLLKIAEQIRSVYPGAEIYVFGSRVNGNYRAMSDYDIVIPIEHESIYAKRIRGMKFAEKVDFKFLPGAKYPVSIP
jgi:predicted nucleotidyltransferase